MQNKKDISLHNRYAPFWAVLMVVFLLSIWLMVALDLGLFCNGYGVDMVGPAFNYILFRGLFTYKTNNWWTRIFTPLVTFISFVIFLFGIEFIQYMEWYPSTFDPLDLLAYLSLLLPLFIFDLIQENNDFQKK